MKAKSLLQDRSRLDETLFGAQAFWARIDALRGGEPDLEIPADPPPAPDPRPFDCAFAKAAPSSSARGEYPGSEDESGLRSNRTQPDV